MLHSPERLPANAADAELIALALAERRCIITSDHDFSRLVALSGESGPSIITMNLSSYRPEVVNGHLRDAIPNLEAALERGALVMITDNRVRIRTLPVTGD